MPLHVPARFVLPAVLLLLGACKDRQITSYRAPKDPAPTVAPAAAPDMANTAVPTGSDSLAWTAPANWVAKAPGPMRKGSFTIPGEAGAEADLSITAFPGDTGGLLANVNRWRGQVSLPPLAEAELGAALEHVDGNGTHFEVADFVGSAKGTPTRLVGAILSRPGETWFFKLMGPDALVAAQKPAFLDFLRTVRETAR